MTFDIEAAFRGFWPNAHIDGLKRLSAGRVNPTWKVAANNGFFVLQCINRQIFQQPEHLEHNLQLVLRHFRQQAPLFRYPAYQISVDGRLLFQDAHGEYWRLYPYIQPTYTVNQVDTIDRAQEAGRAFGSFLTTVAELPVEALKTTISDFHNLAQRLKALDEVVRQDPFTKLANAQEELAFAQARQDYAALFSELVASGRLRLQATHNDCKINNVLFDTCTHQAVAVIDLDTLMPGYLLYDFGDLVRSGIFPQSEDALNFQSKNIRLDFFEGLSRGYIGSATELFKPLKPDEIVFAGRYMAFMLGVRFLTDHLQGDVYFQADEPDQNLRRAQLQFGIVSDMESKAAHMINIVVDIMKTSI